MNYMYKTCHLWCELSFITKQDHSNYMYLLWNDHLNLKAKGYFVFFYSDAKHSWPARSERLVLLPFNFQQETLHKIPLIHVKNCDLIIASCEFFFLVPHHLKSYLWVLYTEVGCTILDNNHSLIMHSHRSLYQTHLAIKEVKVKRLTCDRYHNTWVYVDVDQTLMV